MKRPGRLAAVEPVPGSPDGADGPGQKWPAR
jgi:hypothetical protein